MPRVSSSILAQAVMTAPSDAAIRGDMQRAKPPGSMAHECIRRFEERFLYHSAGLAILVWASLLTGLRWGMAPESNHHNRGSTYITQFPRSWRTTPYPRLSAGVP